MVGGGAKGGPTFSSNASPSRRPYNPLVLVSLPSSRGPSGPHLGTNPLPSPGPSCTHTGARAHPRIHKHWTHARTHIHTPPHAHRGETFLGSVPSLSSSRARRKINIGKPGSNGRASTATSVQAPSRYHPYSSSSFSRCVSPLPVTPLAIPLLH